MSDDETMDEFEYFRDRDPKVRAQTLDSCVERIKENPNQVNVDDLKLVTIGLDDSLLAIRLKCINILQTLLEEAENIPRIVTKIYQKSIKETAFVSLYDPNPKVVTAVLSLFTSWIAVFPDDFSPDDHKEIVRNIYDSNSEFAGEIADFFIATFPSDDRTNLEKILILIEYFDSWEFCPEILGKVFVDKFPPLQDFETIVDYLLNDNDDEKCFKVCQLLAASISHTSKDGSPKKKKAKRDNSVERAEKAVQIIAPKLLDLLEKYSKKDAEWANVMFILCRGLSWSLIKAEFPDVVDGFYQYLERLFDDHFDLAMLFTRNRYFLANAGLESKFENELLAPTGRRIVDKMSDLLDQFEAGDDVIDELYPVLCKCFFLVHVIVDEFGIWDKINTSMRRLATIENKQVASVSFSILTLLLMDRIFDVQASDGKNDDAAFDLLENVVDYISAALFSLERKVLTVKTVMLFLFIYRNLKNAISHHLKSWIPKNDLESVESLSNLICKSFSIEAAQEMLDKFVRIADQEEIASQPDDDRSSLNSEEAAEIDSFHLFNKGVRELLINTSNLLYVL